MRSTILPLKSQNPGKKHLMKLAQHFGLKNGEMVIQDVQSAIKEWDSIAKECGVNKDNIKEIKTRIEAIRNRV